MFQQIRPLANPLMGGCWKENTLQFGLVSENTISIRYLFYSVMGECNLDYFSPQNGKELSLLAEVYLDEAYQFGEVWGWEAVFENTEVVLLAYLIQIERTDGSMHFVIDPYARESHGGERWGTPFSFFVDQEKLKLRVCSHPHGTIPPGLRRLPLLRRALSGEEAIETRPVRPQHSLEESIVYECHLRGMTRGQSGSEFKSKFPGTYKGMAECIPYLKSLGVTAIELLPVFDFDENEKICATENEQVLLNYWGYSPLLFFAPKQNYAADLENPVREFKDMVDKFHNADLEIWLDVVFNHTAEYGENGRIDHFKSLAPGQWYLLEKDGSYTNYSGCGNTLQCAHPTTKRLIRDCLLYWTHVIGVDGFRFDLATILNRDESGDIMNFPQFLWELRNDPSLKRIKLISEP